MNEEQRIAELEIRLSFQDDLLSTLNDVVTEQGFRIQHLLRQLEELRETLGTEPADAASTPLNERPPHY